MWAFGGNCGYHTGHGAGHEQVPVHAGYIFRTTVRANSAPMYVRLPGADGFQQGNSFRPGAGAGSVTAAQPTQQLDGPQDVHGALRLPSAAKSTATTLMVRNLPRRVTLEDLVEELDRSGFVGVYDFLFLPAYFNTGNGKGFAFLNFHSSVMANCFVAEWNRCQRFGLQGRSRISVSEADIQGFEANVAWWEGMENERGRVLILRTFTTEPAEASNSTRSTEGASTAANSEPATSARAAPGPMQEAEEEEIAAAAPPATALPTPSFYR